MFGMEGSGEMSEDTKEAWGLALVIGHPIPGMPGDLHSSVSQNLTKVLPGRSGSCSVQQRLSL